MEKTNFTMAGWVQRLGGLASLVLLVCCLSGFQRLNAQETKLPNSSQTYTGCSGTYTDIGGEDGLYDGYTDNVVRAWSFCPTNPTMQVVKLTFVDFDIHISDNFSIYDSNKVGAGALIVGNVWGGAVSGMTADTKGPAYSVDVFGKGWAMASCKNLSGCLTVSFNDNGDGDKGEGWKFTVECATKPTTLTCGTSQILAQANCALGYARNSWKAPAATYCGLPIYMEVTSTCAAGIRGADFISQGVPDTILANGTVYDFYFPVGRYTITSTIVGVECNGTPGLQADETLTSLTGNTAALITAFRNKFKCTTNVNVATPGLTFNDNVTVSLGAGCQAAINPDMILEDPCLALDFLDLIAFDFGYKVEVETETGVKTGYFNKLGDLEYNWPVISGADVVCRKDYKVTITRRILTDKDCDGTLRGLPISSVPANPAAAADFVLGLLAASYNINDGWDYEEVKGWGYIRFEDKIEPEIETQGGYLSCFDLAGLSDAQIQTKLNNSFKLADVEAYDDCGIVDKKATAWAREGVDCSDAPEVYVGGCSRPATDVYTRVVTVTDWCGNTSSASQTIYVYQPAIQTPVCVDIDCKDLGGASLSLSNGKTGITPAFLLGLNSTKYKDKNLYVPFYDPDYVCKTLNPIMCNMDGYYPYYDGDEIAYNAGHACGYAIDYNDQVVEICPGFEYKIFRRWTILNWCNGEFETGSNDGKEYTQIIKIVSHPDFTVNIPGSLDAKNIGHDCTANYTLPTPADDACLGGAFTYNVSVNGGGSYKPGDVVNLKIGDNTITYAAIFCSQRVSKTYTITVRDFTPPVAVCEKYRQVALSTDGIASVLAGAFDDGSNDACGPVYFKVRRMAESACSGPLNGDDAPAAGNQIWFDDKVKFCCDDVANEVTVVFRVYDRDPGAGPVDPKREAPGGDLFGRYNDCMVQVEVVDKITPMCMPPADVRLDCDKLPNNLDLTQSEFAGLSADKKASVMESLKDAYGFATTIGGCAPVVKELTPAFDLVCRTGTIVRSFQAETKDGQTKSAICKQTITLNEKHDYCITFPADVSGQCGAVIDTMIQTSENACDLLSIRVEDEKFVASGDECFKIFRTFKVINWCEWDKISPAIIINRDEDGDGKPGDEAVTVVRRTNSGGTIYIDRNCTPTDTNPKANENGSNPAGYWRAITKSDAAWVSRGFYQYLQVITVYDDINPIITFGETSVCEDDGDCVEAVTVPFKVTEECTPNDITVTYKLKPFNGAAINDPFGGRIVKVGVIGDEASYQITGGSYPIGAHSFVVTAIDGCGNRDEDVIPFEVKDCKAPNPICINGLTRELMNVGNGMAEVWASDFLVSDIYDCTGQGPEVKNGLLKVKKFSINKVGEARNAATQALTFDCTEVGFQQVELWAYDEAGNYDKCETFINITDLDGFCAPGGASKIAGAIQTENNLPVDQVTVTLSGNTDLTSVTNTTGAFEFATVVKGHDYTVTPVKDGEGVNPRQGISTIDLVKISKHILRTETLDSPYKMIAADVNRSGNISAVDIVELRRLLLFIDTDFKSNTSWVFVPKSFVFPNPSNPWATEFPMVTSFNNLQENVQADFVGIKVGDCTLDAMQSGATAIENRNAGELMINVKDQAVKAGEEYTVTFSAAELATIEGYQFTINFSGLEVVDVEEGAANINNFGFTYADAGMLTTSWNDKAETSELFTLVFKATTNGKLSEMLKVSSQLLQAEAYNTQGEVLNVALRFDGKATAAGFELYQNRPNPFNGKSVIGFNLPESGDATLRIYDVAGKTLKVVQGNYAAGYNQVEISSSDLPATGVLYYTLETTLGSATKKMVIVK